MRALVIGHTGQDGTFLSKDLLGKGYSVMGISTTQIFSSEGDELRPPPNILNYAEISRVIKTFQPTELYYLPAHHVSSEDTASLSLRHSFEKAQGIHVRGLLNCLTAIKEYSPDCKLFYASSSMIFDGSDGLTQNESTRFTPTGIYGITKAQGIWICQEFAQRYSIFASSGILYNHESYLRKPSYLTRKIIQAVIRISSGSKEKLIVGDLSSRVDWSYAPDFTDAFQKIVKLDAPNMFIISSGEAHSVQEFLKIAFEELNLNWTQHVTEDPTILNRRSREKIGDHTKLTKYTGWGRTYSFPDLIRQLIKDEKFFAPFQQH